MSLDNIKVCGLCGKMYQRYGPNVICEDCVKRVDDEYAIVRDYIYENPRADITKVVEATEVSEKVIFHLLRVGRITFAEGIDTGMYCQKCRKPISTGKMCSPCAQKLSETLKGALPKQAPPSPQDTKKKGGKPASRGVKMHTADRHNDT